MSTINLQASWTRLISSSADDTGTSIAAATSDGVVVVGTTYGAIGRTGASSSSAWYVVKYSSAGTQAWGASYDSVLNEESPQVGVGLDGSVYLLGTMSDGNGRLLKFNSLGTLLEQNIYARGGGYLAAANPGIYASGIFWWGELAGSAAFYTNNYVARFDTVNKAANAPEIAGKERWAVPVPAADTGAATVDMASDAAGNVYVIGSTTANPFHGDSVGGGGSDAFIIKYSPAGTESWAQLWGTSGSDTGHSIALSQDGQFVYASYRAGNDIVLAKLQSTNGDVLWTAPLNVGTTTTSQLTVGQDGYIYVGGQTSVAVDGKSPAGSSDIYLVKFNAQGVRLRSSLYGTSAAETLGGIATGADGAIYLTGTSTGNFEGQISAGQRDGFLMRFDRPELTAMTAVNSLISVSQTTQINFTVSESGESLSAADFTVTGGQLSDFVATGNTTYQATFTPDNTTDQVFGQLTLTSNRFSSAGKTRLAIYCFVQGTAIDTHRGPVAIESLRAGDRLRCNAGRYVPLLWLGKQSVGKQMAQVAGICPVLIKRDAFGLNQPQRDLYLSPDHALWIDGYLVEAKVLVNGVSVLGCTQWEGELIYYHLECEHHELIYAEGLLAETFMVVGERSDFDNYNEYPEDLGEQRLMEELALPRLRFTRQMPPRLREYLAERLASYHAQMLHYA